MKFVGLPNAQMFTAVCTTSSNTRDITRKVTVTRPRGDQTSPDVTPRCDPR